MNTGGTSVPITLSKPPIGGEFAAASPLPLPEGETTIKPGQSITETVIFTPTVAGEASGVWKIAGEDTTGQHNVTFHGIGIVPAGPFAPQLLGGLGILATRESAPPRRPDAELAAVALTAGAAGTIGVIVRCPVGDGQLHGHGDAAHAERACRGRAQAGDRDARARLVLSPGRTGDARAAAPDARGARTARPQAPAPRPRDDPRTRPERDDGDDAHDRRDPRATRRRPAAVRYPRYPLSTR